MIRCPVCRAVVDSADLYRHLHTHTDAIGHYRATGGPEPRDPDEITPRRTP